MKEKLDPAVIADLWAVICDRADNPTESSYTSRLLSDPKGIDKVLEKIGEESTEFILAAKNRIPMRTAEEAADVLYHLLVALRASDVDFADVLVELERRKR